MIHKVARTGLMLFLAFLVSASLPLLAQSDTPQTKEDKDKAKAKSKKKNSDVDNIGNRNINKGSINFISLEKEIAMGRQLAAEIERQVKLIDDPVINEYVNRVGQNLVRNSDAKVPFTIKVVESDEINAFALPGGFFYVNSGLILAADDESELAAVMAKRLEYLPRAVEESKGYRVLDGVEELLPRLADEGYLLGLTTGGVEEAARIKLARADLNRYFTQYGEVTGVELKTYRHSTLSTGCAYIQMESGLVAKAAIKRANNQILDDH